MKNIPLDLMGYEKPCRANNFKSGRPSPYELTLRRTPLDHLVASLNDNIAKAKTAKGFALTSAKTSIRMIKSELERRGH